jgi:hypothetical protein
MKGDDSQVSKKISKSEPKTNSIIMVMDSFSRNSKVKLICM